MASQAILLNIFLKLKEEKSMDMATLSPKYIFPNSKWTIVYYWEAIMVVSKYKYTEQGRVKNPPKKSITYPSI